MIAGTISADGLTGNFALGVFGVVIAGVLTFIVIFQGYDSVVDRAEENGLLAIMKKVFMYPFFSAVIGIIYSFLLNILSLDSNLNLIQAQRELISVLLDSILIFLVLYSILSLGEGASFLYRIMVGESGNSSSDIGERSCEGDC
ncbi:hypothetical protein [Haloarcula japonica]|nr:hypothetical protein [Haloarcula japonica]